MEYFYTFKALPHETRKAPLPQVVCAATYREALDMLDRINFREFQNEFTFELDEIRLVC